MILLKWRQTSHFHHTLLWGWSSPTLHCLENEAEQREVGLCYVLSPRLFLPLLRCSWSAPSVVLPTTAYLRDAGALGDLLSLFHTHPSGSLTTWSEDGGLVVLFSELSFCVWVSGGLNALRSCAPLHSWLRLYPLLCCPWPASKLFLVNVCFCCK